MLPSNVRSNSIRGNFPIIAMAELPRLWKLPKPIEIAFSHNILA